MTEIPSSASQYDDGSAFLAVDGGDVKQTSSSYDSASAAQSRRRKAPISSSYDNASTALNRRLQSAGGGGQPSSEHIYTQMALNEDRRRDKRVRIVEVEDLYDEMSLRDTGDAYGETTLDTSTISAASPHYESVVMPLT